MSDLVIPIDPLVEFLVGLLNTPSPTGYPVEANAYMLRAFEALNVPGLSMRVLPKGALVITVQGDANDKPVAVGAHADTLGLMVREIKDSGTLKCTNLGGIVWGGVEYENVSVRTQANRRIRGTVIPVNPSPHVNTNIHKQERNADTMEVRLDAKVFNAADTRALGIEVGDFVFTDPRVEVTDTGFIRSRHLDDKAGVAVIYGALIALRDAGLRPAQTATILIANYEEAGHGGRAGIPDNVVEVLTIDMGALGDGQNGDEYSVSLCVKDSGGPYSFAMNAKLRGLAQANAIPLKPDLYPNYSSDGTVYWRAGGSARVGLIGPGVASSHSYERTHKDSLQHSAHLIARYLLAAVE